MRLWIHYVRQNQKELLLIIIVITLLIILLHLINQKIQIQKQTNQEKEILPIHQDTVSSILLKQVKNLEDGQQKKQELVTFFKYCQDGNLEQAYQALSRECKQLFYPVKKDFQDYLSRYFKERQYYEIQYWKEETFRILFYGDVLENGKRKEAIEEFITIVEEDGQRKLNLNQYIKRKVMQSKITIDELEFNFLYQDIFKEYTQYCFQVTNHTQQTVCLDNLGKGDTVYLLDSKGLRSIASLYEKTYLETKIQEGQTKEITLRFWHDYQPDRKFEQLVFGNVSWEEKATQQITIPL